MLASDIKDIRNGRYITTDSIGDKSAYKGYLIIEGVTGDFYIEKGSAYISTCKSLAEAKGEIDKIATGDTKDATNHMGERSFQTYEAWKRACKAINPSVRFEGGERIAEGNDVCQAKPGIGEWDGHEGIIYTKDSDVPERTSLEKHAAKSAGIGDGEEEPSKVKKGLYKTAIYQGKHVGLRKYNPNDDTFDITTLSKANLRVGADELSNFVL